MCLALLLASCATGDNPDPPDHATTGADPFVPVSAYFVGNSLTWDTIGGRPMGYLGIDMLARQGGLTLESSGFHINCGQSLLAIAEDPNEVCIAGSPYRTLAEALPSDRWDVLTAQPFPGPGSTLLSDTVVIGDLVALAAPGPAISVLTGWPRPADYATTWDVILVDSDTTPTEASRAHFDLLMVRLDDVGVEAVLIPTGEGLYRLDEQLRNGSVPGMNSVADLYRDEIHLNGADMWAASVAAASTILGVPPDRLSKPIPPWFGDSVVFPDGFEALVHETVRSVASGGP